MRDTQQHVDLGKALTFTPNSELITSEARARVHDQLEIVNPPFG